MKLPKKDMPTQESSGSSLFLRLKDGESVTGICRGEAYEFRQKWMNGKSTLVDESDPEGKLRFRLNFVTPEDGKLTAKIFEFGLVVYGQLSEINDEYPLEKTKIKITRRGTGTDTIYMILPILKEPISPKLMKDIEAVPLNILEHKQKPVEPAHEENDLDVVPF